MRLTTFFLVLCLPACPSRTSEDDGEYEGDEAGECEDGADNDQDGDFDCADTDCQGAPVCTGDDDNADDDTADDDSQGDDDSTPGDDDDDTTPAPQGGYMYANTATALYEIDPNPPYTATLVANFSNADPLFNQITDIAIDAQGQMWAVGFFDLYRVNLSTGALTSVGDHLLQGAQTNALAFLADGTLLAGAENQADLYEVNTSSGALTSLGNIGGRRWAGDMVGLPDGLLYCLMSSDGQPASPTNLVAYDVDGASVVDEGATGVGAMYGAGYALGQLFGFDEGGAIYTIDAATGDATAVAQTGIAFWGATTNPVRWSQ
jgi:outer membrane protein assembly factor BamB